MIARLLAMASGKWLLIGVVSAFVALVGVIAVQRHVIQSKNDSLEEARTRIALCEEVNASNARVIEQINRRAAENARAAALERARAERAAVELAEQQEESDARYQAELHALRAALVSDECADRFVPADVAGLYREAATGQD